MVEPLTLGVIVAALVAKALDRAEDQAIEGGEGAIRRLVGLLRERFSGTQDEAASTALVKLEDVPDSPTLVRHLAEVVDQRADTDPGFRAELESLVREARSDGVDVDSIAQVAVGDQNVQSADLVDSDVNVSYGSPPAHRPTPRSGE